MLNHNAIGWAEIKAQSLKKQHREQLKTFVGGLIIMLVLIIVVSWTSSSELVVLTK